MGRAASEALRAQALAQSLTAFLITDAREADFPIVYANDAFLDLTGYNRKEIYGRNCRFLQGDDRDQPGRETVQRALSRPPQFCFTLPRRGVLTRRTRF